MTNAEKVVDFLKKNRGKHWCDECIAKACGFPSTWTAQMLVKALITNPADYHVTLGGCVNSHVRQRRAVSYTAQT